MTKSTFMKLYLIMTGIFMGIADTLPGVSGSTITYILGVYEEFISSISNLTSKKEFVKSFLFLFKMGIGWLIGALTSIIILNKYAKHHIYFISSIFLGLIVVAIFKTYKDINKNYGFKIQEVLFLILGIFFTIIIFFFGWSAVELLNGPYIYVYIFVVSVLAISTMLLPGVSGSTVLLVFGLYYPVITVLNDMLKGDFSKVSYFLIFCIGVIFGLFVSAKIINKVFHKYKSLGLNLILGILIGSVIPIIYGPLTIEGMNYRALNFSNFSIAGFILGIVLLFLLEILNNIRVRKNNEVDNESK